MTDTNEQAAETRKAEKSKKPLIGRRDLIVGAGGAAVLLALGGVRYAGAEPLVRPPGGQNADQLLAACVRCQKCSEVCPRGIIVPAHIESGVWGMRTPELCFDYNWCNWCADTNDGKPLCAAVCPTLALELSEGETFESLKLGEAHIDRDTCLGYRLTGCRFCYDACKAARGEEQCAIWLDEENRPHLDADACNGCGACESVCVSLKEASISQGATRRAICVYPLD